MKILNFGSLNLDRVYAVEHFVQEGETLSAGRMETHCGGKGLNQSVALARAGASVLHAGCVGEDGGQLIDCLRESGVDVRHVQTVDQPTGHAVIQVLPGGQNGILLFSGANRCLTEQGMEAALAECGAGDWLLLQNETNLTGRLAERGAAQGLKVVFNPSPADSRLNEVDFHHLSCCLFNEIEAASLTGETEPQAILDAFRRQYPSCATVLTLGAGGAWYDDGEQRLHQPAFPAKAVDTTGAGDTFTGYFLAAMMAGDAPGRAMRLASAAAALAVTRKGAANAIPWREEVEKLLV
ncbi:MAG: ribokinase [Clostridiales bacterium]|nr:ribokinase [Clostridiales bacterium]